MASGASRARRTTGSDSSTGSRSSRSWLPSNKTSTALIVALAAFAVYWARRTSQDGHSSLWTLDRSPPIDWHGRRQEVRRAFEVSWDSYAQSAWGYDIYDPVSKTGTQMSPHGLGWIIVDSLDTLMIMNLTSRLGDARRWISRHLDFDQDQDVNTFETTIRMLGGLLSAHYLSKIIPGASSQRDRVYLQKSIDLANRLLGAYDSPSGIPYGSVHLGDGVPFMTDSYQGASSTAEAATVQLEMKYLSHLTGNAVYWRKAERVMKVLDDNEMEAGLLPIYVHPDDGKFTTSEIRLGSRGDSYYEYLIKQYHQTSEPVYLDMWNEALEGIEKHLVTYSKTAHLRFIAELPGGVGLGLLPKMDHLVCFLPASIALGVTGGLTEDEARKLQSWSAVKERQMLLARELTKTCWGMYAVTATGLAPEIAWFRADGDALRPRPGDRVAPPVNDTESVWTADYDIRPADAHNLQRPETVESLFVMWRVTRDPVYREWGWKIFQAFQRHALVPDGTAYTSLNDVTRVPARQRNNMESFWLSETLKYLYLLFSDDHDGYLSLTDVVFNTEAHVFPRLNEKDTGKQTEETGMGTGKGKFMTGWQRKKRRRH